MCETITRYYLVGGAVRDLLWGRTPHEYDYAFSGSPELFLQKHPAAHMVGKRDIRVFLLDGQEFMPLRGETLANDLLQRDLTINALALDEHGTLYAHPQALADLQSRVLRAASPQAFSDDPARIFRFARFAALFPQCQLDEASCEQAKRIAASEPFRAIPAERVGRELLKACAGEAPGRFLETLHRCEALNYWFEEFLSAAAIPAGPLRYHTHHVLGHTVDVMNRAAGDPLAVWMALCHDLGKVLTDPEQWPHHYGHELLGVDSAIRLGERLALPKQYCQAGELAVKLHMKAGMYETLRLGTRCDLLMAAHQARVHNAFWRLAEADSQKKIKARVDADRARILAVRLPVEWQNKGEASGRYLRELRCHALAQAIFNKEAGNTGG